jgi:hypothetical protein
LNIGVVGGQFVGGWGIAGRQRLKVGRRFYKMIFGCSDDMAIAISDRI